MSTYKYSSYSELKKLSLKDVTRVNHYLGSGFFGSTELLLMKGERVAGKTYHKTSLSRPGVSIVTAMRRIAAECQILIHTRHQNIVQFVGICFLQEHIPTLVTELMHCSLDSFIKCVDSVQLEGKLHILREVARGDGAFVDFCKLILKLRSLHVWGILHMHSNLICDPLTFLSSSSFLAISSSNNSFFLLISWTC